MAEKTRVYLASDARGLSAAEGQGLPCVYLFYRVGDGGALQRAQLPAAARGGLMGVFEAPGLADADPPKLARDMAGECARRGYAGVFLDLAPAPQTVTPLAALSQELKRLRVVHYVPVSLLAAAPGARAVVPGAVSGGSFASLLDELCARWGADNVALDLQRMRSVFDMPSFSPEGRALPREESDALLGRCRPSVFFSPSWAASISPAAKTAGRSSSSSTTRTPPPTSSAWRGSGICPPSFCSGPNGARWRKRSQNSAARLSSARGNAIIRTS